MLSSNTATGGIRSVVREEERGGWTEGGGRAGGEGGVAYEGVGEV